MWDHWVHWHKKIYGNCPRGSAKQQQNVFVFSVTNTMQPFGHLSCIDFDHVRKNRCALVCQSTHPWKIYEFLLRVLQAPKMPPEVVVWVGCLLPAYSWKVCNKSTQPRTLCVMGNKNWPKCYRGVKAGVAHSTWFLYDPPLTRVIHEYLEMSRSC